MDLLSYTTTDTAATPTGASIDTHARGRREVSFAVQSLGAATKWTVQGSADNSVWTTVQAERTIGADNTQTWRVSPPRYRYYRVTLKSAVALTPATCEITLYRHDYIETGTVYSATVGDEQVEHAEELIDRATNDHFASRLETFTLFGDGSRRLSLLPATPLSVLSVVSASVVDSAEATQTIDVAEVRLTDRHWLELSYDYTHTWYVGPGDRENVSVTCYVGWSTTPAPIRRAAQTIASNAVQKTSENVANFEMEKIGEYTYQKSTRVEQAFQVTGDPEIDRILSDYANRVASIGVVF